MIIIDGCEYMQERPSRTAYGYDHATAYQSELAYHRAE